MRNTINWSPDCCSKCHSMIDERRRKRLRRFPSETFNRFEICPITTPRRRKICESFSSRCTTPRISIDSSKISLFDFAEKSECLHLAEPNAKFSNERPIKWNWHSSIVTFIYNWTAKVSAAFPLGRKPIRTSRKKLNANWPFPSTVTHFHRHRLSHGSFSTRKFQSESTSGVRSLENRADESLESAVGNDVVSIDVNGDDSQIHRIVSDRE